MSDATAVRRATIVYWYAGADLRLDGGGQRALGWRAVLEQLGYEVTVVPLWTLGGTPGFGAALSKVKRALLPTPIRRNLPDIPGTDLVVVTVPAVFSHAIRVLPMEKLVFDWMDLWSVSSRNVGDSSIFSRLGGILQGRMWRRLEKTLPAGASVNTYAGFDDFSQMRGYASNRVAWLPNPTEYQSTQRPTLNGPIRRVGFVGSLNYPPNELSLREFFRDYSARCEAHGIEIVVAGFSSERVRDWGVNATVLGQIDSLADFYAGIDAAIVPIKHGSGIKAKAVEALSFGVPVFGTNHVRSGFAPEFREWILDLEDLFSDSPTTPRMSRQEFEAAFSQAAFASKVRELLQGWTQTDA